MSSHRLSASGERQYTITAGGGAFTAAQVPSKPGDRVAAQIGQVGEIKVVLPPSNVRLERYRSPRGSVIQVLVIEGPLYEWEDRDPTRGVVSIVVHGEPLDSNHPLTNVDVRKADETDPVLLTVGKDAELADTIDLAIPPTES